MEYIEVTGRTIDDALTNACLKLETTSDNILIQSQQRLRQELRLV